MPFFDKKEKGSEIMAEMSFGKLNAACSRRLKITF